MPSPLFQGLGRERICRDRFHQRQSKIEQFTGSKYVSRRISYSSAVVRRLPEQAVDDLCEKAVRPVRMNAVAGGIKFLHCAPNPAAILQYGHPIARDSLAWNVGDMFDVVEEGHGIMIGTEQYDLAIEP